MLINGFICFAITLVPVLEISLIQYLNYSVSVNKILFFLLDLANWPFNFWLGHESIKNQIKKQSKMTFITINSF